jgi:prepilin-type N-terminal cleavage/methylation domain-containing protein
MQRNRAKLGGWTLIELLVVMGIMGILMALAVPSLFSVYERARKTQAKNDLTQIVSAVNAYYTEYGQYPTTLNANAYFGSGTLPPGATSAGTNNLLFNELQACHVVNGVLTPSCCSAADALNTRQIAYISPRCWGTATARSGIGTNGQYYDPWGTPYNIEINAFYNNQIANPYPDTTPPNADAGAPVLSFGVIGWSYGKDQTPGSPASPNYGHSDDVLSWQ